MRMLESAAHWCEATHSRVERKQPVCRDCGQPEIARQVGSSVRRNAQRWTRRFATLNSPPTTNASGRDVMKFGIFYELQLPRPWEAGDELKLYHDALTQLETADRLGYDYAWVVEHHFLEEYSHSPSPESFLAAASQR